VQLVEQMGGRVGVATPVVRDGAVGEERVHGAWVHQPVLRHERAQRARATRLGAREGTARFAWMHQRLQSPRYEPIVDEKILLDGQLAVSLLEVEDAVTRHPLTQDQILRASGRADGVGLHEAKPLDRGGQRVGLSERTSNGVVAQVSEGRHGHNKMAP